MNAIFSRRTARVRLLPAGLGIFREEFWIIIAPITKSRLRPGLQYSIFHPENCSIAPTTVRINQDKIYGLLEHEFGIAEQSHTLQSKRFHRFHLEILAVCCQGSPQWKVGHADIWRKEGEMATANK